MDEQQPVTWRTPWRWSRGIWFTALLIWPPLYLLSVFVADQWVGKEPGWGRTIAEIIRAPLEPVRKPFRRTATRPNPLYMPSNCEVCGEVAFCRFWDLATVDATPVGRVRSFCDQHNREYIEAPADALKPDGHSSVESFFQRP